MGPALGGKITTFAGVKGGVGCSVLTALLGRIAAGKSPQKIAVVDATPFLYSSLPAYLSVPSPNHTLAQLQPYQDRLTSKMVENFFPTSPEGAVYVPLKASDDPSLPYSDSLRMLKTLSQWFQEIFIDFSSFPNDQFFNLLEISHRVFFISSFDPGSLTAITQWENRLLPFHFQLQNIGLIFNQTNPTPKGPKDPSGWSKHLGGVGIVPFLGEGFSIDLLESQSIPPGLEKILSPFAEKALSNERFFRSPLTEGPEINPQAGEVEEDPATLEQVHQLHQKLLEELRKTGALKDAKNNEVIQRQALEPNAREILSRLIQGMDIQNRETGRRLVSETLDMAFGLGPLEPLLQDEVITEIMVNGPHRVFVEKKGLLEETPVRFLDDQQLRTVIERILAPIGRRIDESQPYVDGRLLDGSRVNAVLPPLSLNGPLLTIRKFSKKKLKIEDLVQFGSLTREAADFLGACVKAKKNIVVSGGTGSGKTTLLNILSNFIPSRERIVTIEDSAELQLSQDHVVRLESRPANLEGKGQVAIRDLVINALRMRPDRIVVGECRGGETLDMLQAMNTGHDGSLTTAHANSPRDLLARLETMCLFTGLDLPLKAVREQISRAVHLVVQQSRLPNGKRSVTQISQIQGMEGDIIILQDLFTFGEEGTLTRRPFAPSFIQDLNAVGYQWPGKTEKAKT